MRKRARIICTIGPASEGEEILRELVKNGMDIARLNLSHGDREEHITRINTIQRIRQELNIPVAILLDTRGPEIRTGKMTEDTIQLVAGDDIIITAEECLGDIKHFSISYHDLYKDVKPGNTILIDDGLIALKVTNVNEDNKEIKCTVLNGGDLKERKGINVPGINVKLPVLTEKDKDDILFGIEQGVDFIACSFVRSKSNVEEIRELLNNNNGKEIKVISKIESQEGIDNIDEIIEVSDAIMIARGDLGVETPNELIPALQKMIIKKCNYAGVPVITATQMLDSMIHNPRPTRAEVSDVANAVLDGTDALMLSGETAAGSYPIESVKEMSKVIYATEHTPRADKIYEKIEKIKTRNITGSVSYASCTTAVSLDAAAIICPTHSGRTAQNISMFRPDKLIIATTSVERVQRQMQLLWGVCPLLVDEEQSEDILFYRSTELSKQMGILQKGDIVVITAGIPLGISGTTNVMKVQIVR